MSECPLCGIRLRELPALAEELFDDEGVLVGPERRLFPMTFLGRGRGLLVGLAVCGLGLFFAPWVHMTLPDETVYTGFDVARRLGWSWAPAAAWFVLIPTVLSRRTLVRLRSARLAVAFLATVPAVTATLLLLFPPQATRYVPLRFTFSWGLWATLAVALTSLVVSYFLGLGGRAPRPPPL